MQAKQSVYGAAQQQGQQHVRAEAAVGHRQVAALELVEQSLEQAQLRLVLVALGVVEQHAGGQTKEAHQLH